MQLHRTPTSILFWKITLWSFLSLSLYLSALPERFYGEEIHILAHNFVALTKLISVKILLLCVIK